MKKFKIEFHPNYYPSRMNVILTFSASSPVAALSLCYNFIKENLPYNPDHFMYEITPIDNGTDEDGNPIINFAEDE